MSTIQELLDEFGENYRLDALQAKVQILQADGMTFDQAWHMVQGQNPELAHDYELTREVPEPKPLPAPLVNHSPASEILSVESNETVLVEGAFANSIWPGDHAIDDLVEGADRSFKKMFKDHVELASKLSGLLKAQLIEKGDMIRAAAASGQAKLLDYAHEVMTTGWEEHFPTVAKILGIAAHESSNEIIQQSGANLSDALNEHALKAETMIAREEAARVLGVTYNPARDVALANPLGVTPGELVLRPLAKELAQADEEGALNFTVTAKWVSGVVEPGADALAQNALADTDGRAAFQAAAWTAAQRKRSETAGDSKVCPECFINARAGWLPLDALFPGSGTAETPHHRNCRCNVTFRWRTQSPEQSGGMVFTVTENE